MPRVDLQKYNKKVENPVAILWRLVCYFKHCRLLLTAAMLSILAYVAATIGAAYCMKPLTNLLEASGAAPNETYAKYISLILGLAGLYLLSALTNYLLNRLMLECSAIIMKQLRTELFDTLQHQPVRFFDENKTGALMSYYTSDIEATNELLQHSITQLAISITSLLGTIGMMLALSMRLFAIMVVLGAIVVLFARSGGSRAFGEWASRRVRSRRGAETATATLGCLIFLDDYFNCLTVGAIMQPIADRFRISREKLAFLIDATAAPVCIIAPISSWAAAVSSYIPAEYAGTVNGFTLFLRAIPYNFYALLMLWMVFVVALTGRDFGPMYRREQLAAVQEPPRDDRSPAGQFSPRGRAVDLLVPTVCLIVSVVWGMVLLGRRACREGGLPLTASNVFANTDAPMALCFGCAVTLLVMAVLYIPRGVVTFSGYVEGFLDGFKLMTPALLVLTFAWGLKSFAARLDAAAFVQGLFAGRETLTALFPLVLFLVGGLLAFATGTSWGTMGILIPVAVPVFAGSSLLPAAVAAVCAGAVMGDHCSPISDTTIMSSTGAGCDHMAHVTTQLWYGLVVGADCAVCYLLAAALGEPWLPLAVGAALVVGQVFFFHRLSRRREGAA